MIPDLFLDTSDVPRSVSGVRRPPRAACRGRTRRRRRGRPGARRPPGPAGARRPAAAEVPENLGIFRGTMLDFYGFSPRW